MPEAILYQSGACATLPAAAGLAAEWAWFERVEAGESGPVLCLWEAGRHAVVVGRHGRADEEVWLDACDRDRVEVTKRQSGGGTVLVGPGCLNFAFVVPLSHRPEFVDIAATFRTMGRWLVAALSVPGMAQAGHADLTWGGRKVAGQAQRRGRRALLHHGTLLCAFDIPRVGRYLREPRRQPAYRQGRTHEAFLANLPIDVSEAARRLSSSAAAFGVEHAGGPRGWCGSS